MPAHRLLVPKLKRRQDLAQMRLGLAIHLLHSLVTRCREYCHIHRLGPARAEDRNRSDNANAPLGPDKQLLQVKA